MKPGDEIAYETREGVFFAHVLHITKGGLFALQHGDNIIYRKPGNVWAAPNNNEENILDPDEVLKNLRQAAEHLDHQIDTGNLDLEAMGLHVSAMVHSFLSLDGWLTKGGSVPQAWAQQVAAEQTGEKK